MRKRKHGKETPQQTGHDFYNALKGSESDKNGAAELSPRLFVVPKNKKGEAAQSAEHNFYYS